MASYVWRFSKKEYRRGYLLVANELFYEYYDWEEDPMCDCTPSRKYRKPTGKWEIEAYRTYAYSTGKMNHVDACNEAWESTSEISEEAFTKLWNELIIKDIPLVEVGKKLKNARYEAEAMRYMP